MPDIQLLDGKKITFEKIGKESAYYLDAQSSLAINYLYNSLYYQQ